MQAQSSAAIPSAEVGATPLGSSIDFDVVLKMGDPAGAQALARSVSDPNSPQYGPYVTPGQWEQAFSPSPASVKAVTSWLRSEHITVDSVAADRMTVHATASTARVESAFAVQLEEYRRLGQTVRLAAGGLTVRAAWPRYAATSRRSCSTRTA